ncbi:MAG: methylenetetrahydrofolate reductase [NAD(P)H] [Bacteroidetes bacterium]|nr:methylenetetrahydrofolate reductase [NAD(P)H] [Bacteroidota bacterium]
MNKSHHIKDILKNGEQTFSFEFFPPRTQESSEQLLQTIKKLSPLNPSFVSVTYGAGGRTRELTHELVVKLQHEVGFSIVAHLTCIGSTKDEVKNILQKYWENKILNIMALRGDPPKGVSSIVETKNEFKYAEELVKFIKINFSGMGIGVAGFPEGHPDSLNIKSEMEFLKAKVDAGADYICTQLFFDNNAFYKYREMCEKLNIQIPIIAGIMPITTKKGMERMSELAKGSTFPEKLISKISNSTDDSEVEKIGIDWATEQVMGLVENKTSGIHFYTLNKSKATLEILKNLNIKSQKKII